MMRKSPVASEDFGYTKHIDGQIKHSFQTCLTSGQTMFSRNLDSRSITACFTFLSLTVTGWLACTEAHIKPLRLQGDRGIYSGFLFKEQLPQRGTSKWSYTLVYAGLDELSLSSSLTANGQSLEFTTEQAEGQRPLFHITPDFGWSNDPNGMVQYMGVHHLFFQHTLNQSKPCVSSKL